jgi:hypothetical protein
MWPVVAEARRGSASPSETLGSGDRPSTTCSSLHWATPEDGDGEESEARKAGAAKKVERCGHERSDRDHGNRTREIPDPPSGPSWLPRDSWTEAERHLRASRNPELLVSATLQPIMFVVLFVYVFEDPSTLPGYSSYKQFVIPGIFAQTVLFGSIYTGLGIAEDLSRFVERLRSLPMYPSAVLYGRTISDARNAVSFVVMLAVAFAVASASKDRSARPSLRRSCCSSSHMRSAGSRL